MQRMDAGGTLASRPSPNATSSPGWANNDPSGSSPPTIFDPDWANGIEAELEAIIAAGTGAALSKTATNQVLTAIQALIGSATGVAGSARNMKASLTSAGSSITFAADEVVVETALGATCYKLPNFSETLNIGNVGAGGMDQSGAVPPNGFVAIYAGYNPSTQTQTIFGCNAATSSTTIYSGGHAPSGVTATSLIGLWPTNGSSQLVPGNQVDRRFRAKGGTQVLSAGSASSMTAISLSSCVPPAATRVRGWGYGVVAGSGSAVSGVVSSDGSGTDFEIIGQNSTGSGGIDGDATFDLILTTAQQISYSVANGTLDLFVTGYEF